MTEKREGSTETTTAGLVVAPPWQLRPYGAGTGLRPGGARPSRPAGCGRLLPGQYALEVIDLHQSPQPARRDQGPARLLLVRRQPRFRQGFGGDLPNPARLLRRLPANAPC